MWRIWLSLLGMAGLAACSSGGGDASGPGTSEPPAADAPRSSAAAPSALFVLGDSLSDVGNAAGAADYVLNLTVDPPTVGLCNPVDVRVLHRSCDDLFYRRSRVSDGPVAVEYLASHLGLGALQPSLHVVPGRGVQGTVYAVAGAKARTNREHDLAHQVDWLLADQARLAGDAVYVVMIGGNDAVDALQADGINGAGAPRPSAAIAAASAAAIKASVERLLHFGARRIVVANVPDLAALPRVRLAARASADEAALLAAASGVSAAFDRELAAALDGIEADARWSAPTPPDITRFDLRAALAAAERALAVHGANTTDACFDTDTYRDSPTAERRFHRDCAPLSPEDPPRFAGFAFFDGLHPTGAAHAEIGAALSALF